MRVSLCLLAVLATLALLALPGCSGSTPTPPDEPPVGPDDDGPAVVEVPPASTRLADLAVETVEDGPWTVRRTVSPRPTERPGDTAAPAERRLMGRAEGGVVATGAAPPPGAPARDAAPEPEASPMDDAEAPDAGGETHGGEVAAKKKADGGRGSARLRAASTDDNAEFEAFLTFLARWSDREDVAGRFQPLDVRERRFVRVLDATGRPVPSARVSVVDESADRVVWVGTSYGDGRVPFYPLVAAPSDTAVPVVAAPGAGFLVEVRSAESVSRMRWDGAEDLVVRLDAERPLTDPLRLDVCFVLDTTGSMGDEIQRIKGSLLRMTEKLRGLRREFDLRYGAVLYRDVGDAYVTKLHPFTGDIEAFAAALEGVQAAGGGDGPESLNQGLAEAMGRMGWREGAAKVAFLIADAPPHMDYQGDAPYGVSVRSAVGQGIRVHAVAASGLGALGSLIFRQIAQFARGKFIFIEYGSAAASAASHGVGGTVKSNNLDDILFEQIRDELARWGRDS